jgi:hypothetical protein
MLSSPCLQSFEGQASAFSAVFLKAARKRSGWLVVLFFALTAILAAPLPAQADPPKEMLFLSTFEGPPSNAQTININNASNAFQAQASIESLTFVNGRNWLSGSTSLPITADTKLIVIVTGHNLINADRMTELQKAIETNPNLAVVIFSESCSDSGSVGGFTLNCWQSRQNLDGFMTTVEAIKPELPEWSEITLGTGTTRNYTARLNMSSLYESTFSDAGLSTLTAGNYTPIINVPLNYALYTQTALPPSPPAIVTQNVVGLFIPQAASNSGKGACLFLTADASEFTNNHPEQFAPIARAFTTAALDPNGACARPAVGAPDLWPTLDLTSLSVNVVTDVTLTVQNANQAASAATVVTLTLPPGVNLVSPPSGCTATSSSFTCPVPALDKSGSESFKFQIIAPTPIDKQPLLVEVESVDGEINTTNNELKLEISAPGYPDLAIQIFGPGNLVVNSPATYRAVVTNVGNMESDNGTVEITLPDGTKLDPSLLPSDCTAISDTRFTCTLAAIAQGKSVTIPFTLTATETFSDQPIKADVAGVSGERSVDMDNNSDAMDISAALTGAMDAPQPVPTLAELALALLALMVAGGAAARLRREG